MIRFSINGREAVLDVDPDMPLLWALRDHAGVSDPKYGCGIAQCGACTVLVDGQPTRSCVTPVSAVEGAAVGTVTGIDGPVADAVRAAWAEIDVVQCGYCQPGQMTSAIALLTENPRPSDEEIVAAMDGNLCRCGTYLRIRAAVRAASETLG